MQDDGMWETMLMLMEEAEAPPAIHLSLLLLSTIAPLPVGIYLLDMALCPLSTNK